MSESKQDLQNFTNASARVAALFAQPSITRQDVDALTVAENTEFYAIANAQLSKLQDYDRDDFLAKIYPILNEDSRNHLWRVHHFKILSAINILMRRHGHMPPVDNIAEATGLSRPTVYKHLREAHTHPLFVAHVAQYRLLLDQVLAALYQSALDGDAKAARLFFEMVNGGPPRTGGDTFIQQQNNFVQINGVRLDLNPEQLDQVQRIVGGAGSSQ